MPGDDQRPWPTNTIQGMPAWFGGEDGLVKANQEALRSQFFRMYQNIPAAERARLERERAQLEAQKFYFDRSSGEPIDITATRDSLRPLDEGIRGKEARLNKLQRLLTLPPADLNATERSQRASLKAAALAENAAELTQLRAEFEAADTPEKKAGVRAKIYPVVLQKKAIEQASYIPALEKEFHDTKYSLFNDRQSKLGVLANLSRSGDAAAEREFRTEQERYNRDIEAYTASKIRGERFAFPTDDTQRSRLLRGLYPERGFDVIARELEQRDRKDFSTPEQREAFLWPTIKEKTPTSLPDLLAPMSRESMEETRREAERLGIDPREYLGRKLRDIRRKFETDIPEGVKAYQDFRTDEVSFSRPVIGPDGKKVLDPVTGLPVLEQIPRVVTDTPEGHVKKSDEAFAKLISDPSTDKTFADIQTKLLKDPNSADAAIAKLDSASTRPIKETYDQYVNPYLGAALTDVTNRSKQHFQRDLLPQLRSKFIQGNAYNTGAREQKERHLAEDFGRDLQDRLGALQMQGSDMAMRLASAARDREVDVGKTAGMLGAEQEHEKSRRAEQMANMATRRDVSKLTRADMQHQIAERHRNYAQRSRDLEYDEFRRQQELPVARAAQYSALLHGAPVPTYTFSVAGNRPPPNENPQTLMGGALTTLAGAMLRRPSEAPFKKGGRIKKSAGGELPYGLTRFADSPEYQELKSRINKLDSEQTNPFGDALMNLGASLMKNSSKGPLGALSEGAPSFVEGYRGALDENERRKQMALALKDKLHSSIFSNNMDIAKILAGDKHHEAEHAYKMQDLALKERDLREKRAQTLATLKAKYHNPFDRFRLDSEGNINETSPDLSEEMAEVYGEDVVKSPRLKAPKLASKAAGVGQYRDQGNHEEPEEVEEESKEERQEESHKKQTSLDSLRERIRAKQKATETPFLGSKAAFDKKAREEAEKSETEEAETRPQAKRPSYNENYNSLVYHYNPRTGDKRDKDERKELEASVSTLRKAESSIHTMETLRELSKKVNTGPFVGSYINRDGVLAAGVRKINNINSGDYTLMNKMAAVAALDGLTEFLSENKNMRGSKELLRAIQETKVSLSNTPETNVTISNELIKRFNLMKNSAVEKLEREGFQKSYIKHHLDMARDDSLEDIKRAKEQAAPQKKKDNESRLAKDSSDFDFPKRKGTYTDQFGIEQKIGVDSDLTRNTKLAINALTPFGEPFDVKDASDAEKMGASALSFMGPQLGARAVISAVKYVPKLKQLYDVIANSDKASKAINATRALANKNKVTKFGKGVAKFGKEIVKGTFDPSKRAIASSGAAGATYEGVRQENPDSVLIPMTAGILAGGATNILGGASNAAAKAAIKSGKGKQYYDEIANRFLPSLKSSAPEESVHRLAQKSADKGFENYNKKVGAFADNVKKGIGKDKVEFNKTKSFFEANKDKFETPEMERLLTDSNYGSIQKFLNRKGKEIFIDNAIDLRKSVGDAAKFEGKTTVESKALENLYHTISDDIGRKAAEKGKDVARSWKKYNDETSFFKGNEEKKLEGLLRSNNASKTIVEDMGKEGTGKTTRLATKYLPENEKGKLVKDTLSLMAREAPENLTDLPNISYEKLFKDVWPNLNRKQRLNVLVNIPEARHLIKNKDIIDKLVSQAEPSVIEKFLNEGGGFFSKTLKLYQKALSAASKPEKLVKRTVDRHNSGFGDHSIKRNAQANATKSLLSSLRNRSNEDE